MRRAVRRDEGFGLRLIEAMDRAGVRPSALAKAQNVSPGTVSRWRAGECPDDLRFPSLAAFLQSGRGMA
jgi:transcriptional regulator with XRE-family HTH domain